MQINFSTGTFYKLNIPLKDWANILSKLDLDGVELTFKKWEEFEEVLSNHEFTSFLKKYKTNTIHVPFGLNYDDDFKSQFNEIIKLAHIVDAKYLVCHIYNFNNLELINDIDYKFTLENTLTGDWNGNKFVSFIAEKKYKITLDTSHCLNFGEKELSLLFNNLKNHITSIHLSNIVDGHHHRQFYSHPEDWSKVSWIFKELPKTTIITLEENFKDISEMLEELKFIREHIDK
jgi:hypothetical protein